LVSISGENVFVMIAMPCGISRAPKAPCATRATISNAGSGDRPATAEATVKPAIPIRKSLRCPYLSPSRPPTMSSTPMASMYAVPSHLIRPWPPCSCLAMVGAAMLVTVASITSRASASSTSARIAHISREEVGRVVVAAPALGSSVSCRGSLLFRVGPSWAASHPCYEHRRPDPTPPPRFSYRIRWSR
jgi:hypothetical protein